MSDQREEGHISSYPGRRVSNSQKRTSLSHQILPSNPAIHASPSSTALHAIRPPTSHQFSKCLLTNDRSPRVIADVSVKRAELKTRLLRTKRPNLTGEGIFSNFEQDGNEGNGAEMPGALRLGRRAARSEAVVVLRLDIADEKAFKLCLSKDLSETLL